MGFCRNTALAFVGMMNKNRSCICHGLTHINSIAEHSILLTWNSTTKVFSQEHIHQEHWWLQQAQLGYTSFPVLKLSFQQLTPSLQHRCLLQASFLQNLKTRTFSGNSSGKNMSTSLITYAPFYLQKSRFGQSEATEQPDTGLENILSPSLLRYLGTEEKTQLEFSTRAQMQGRTKQDEEGHDAMKGSGEYWRKEDRTVFHQK